MSKSTICCFEGTGHEEDEIRGGCRSYTGLSTLNNAIIQWCRYLLRLTSESQTNDRGFGLRATRSFQPNQIIVEYCGEIISQEETESRMKKIYKNNSVRQPADEVSGVTNEGCSPIILCSLIRA